MHKPTKQF
jgi:hypothetical protein